jgi:hypothetical protein
MTTVRPFKFLIQVVLLEQDSEGNPIGEKVSEPTAIYGIEGLRMFIDNLDAQTNEDGVLREKPDIVLP